VSAKSIVEQVRARARRVTAKEIAQLYPHYPKPSQVKTFYAAMGKAIAAWQSVESSLYEVYRACTRAAIPGAEAAAFFSVAAFRAKLTLTSAAVNFIAHDQIALLNEWKALSNRAAHKADRRNEIAHGAVWTMFQEKRKDRKIYIGPSMFDPREAMKRKPGQDTEPLTLKRVRDYEKDFRVLGRRLSHFAHRIPRPSTQPPQSA